MPDKKEINFLPPLSMPLTFLDRKPRKSDEPRKTADRQRETDEKNVEKLIEKLSEKEE